MCGILSIFSNERIKTSCEYLKSRGPENCNILYTDNASHIFYRLAINDTISKEANQPFTSNDNSIVMMCNGEIYNFKRLEQEHELKCKSNSDCEPIMYLYKKFGFVETVKKLYGVYAIMLVDKDIVYLARDRIGVRPLYFGLTFTGTFVVSSLPQSILDICTSVQEFPPGMTAMFELNSLEKNKLLRCLSIDNIRLPMTRISNNPYKEIQNCLFKSVSMRLVSDRPIGCLLSGGLDSSIIASVLTKLGVRDLKTFSIGMEGSPDLICARKVSEYLKTEHTEVQFSPEEGIEAIEEVIKNLASYDITTIRASIPMYLLCRYISKYTDVKVVFSGEGSDELFGGYLYFHNAPSKEDFENETINLLNNLHNYDVLRADRCISNNGLEPRVPFLDKDFVDMIVSLPVNEKIPVNGIEKFALRKAFEGFLPQEILLRRKEAFSDGVSQQNKSWYQYLQEYINDKISDNIFNSTKYPSKEAMYYRLIFEKHFPTYNFNIPYWLPKWSNETKEPSARTLDIYKQQV
jgi:asparagine synthase (glutamine-hydrolysing)